MQYNFCSHCGAPLPSGSPFSPQECNTCGSWHYHNSKPCAGALVIRANKVLLAKRAIEPFEGYWDIPGGFLEAGEHPEAGAIRELLEETGLEIRLTGLLGIYMDSYGAANYYTLNLYYLAEIITGTPRATDDVAELQWFALSNLPTQFAFAHEYNVMNDLQFHLSARIPSNE